MGNAASRTPGWRTWLWRGIIALALVLAFVAYQDPHLMLQLGNQLLSCF
ncbi:hypothetical protein QRD43_14795 [Pelomonas sp. APW6]|uniref:Uncharacterized protein n=1 Tax=Roseateles subflavus TaxID=3053353 RepID=A0ABT7LNB0_9BURK|nr:hypothetical protein [Pelomonas sp. APW6]MDL5033180.1 hypothetical protein [Pelomonas sp. APW6]